MEISNSSASPAETALQKVVDGKNNKVIQLADLQELLSNDDFHNDMLVATSEVHVCVN